MTYKIIFAILCSIAYNNCIAQESYLPIDKIKLQKLTPNFEKFDIVALDKIVINKVTKKYNTSGNVPSTPGSKSKREILNTSGKLVVKEKDLNNNLIKETYKTDQSIVDIEYLDNFFTLTKQYYPNGRIRQKGIGSWLGFDIGKVYFFDKKGKIIEVRDTNIGYAFDYDKLINFCLQNAISLKRPNGGPRLMIRKGIFKYDNKPSWFIEAPDFEIQQYKISVLDGITGEVKFEEKKPFIKDGL